MRALPTWAEVREADRLDGAYRTLVAKRRGGEGPSPGWLAFKWGWPLLPLAAMAVGADMSSRWWPATMALFVAAAVAYGDGGVVRRTPFEALRFPSTGALLVARFVGRLPWLCWVMACTGALRAMQVAQSGGASARTAVLVAGLLALAPIQALAARTAYVAAEALHPRPRWHPLAFLAAAVAGLVVSAAGLWPLRGQFDDAFLGAFFVYPRSAGLAAFSRTPVRYAVAVVDFTWLLIVASVVAGRLGSGGSDVAVDTALALAIAYVLVASPLLVRWAAARRPTFSEREEKAAAATGEAVRPAAEPKGGARLVREAPGTTFDRAMWRRWRLLARRQLAFGGSRVARFLWVLLGVPVWFALTVARGALAAAAVVAFADEPRIPWIVFAVGAVLFAPALVDEEPSERLYLLGVDLRAQRLRDLRAYVLVAALPTLAAALATAAWLDFRPSAVGAAATIAALLLLRAGWKRAWAGWSGAATFGALLVALPVAEIWGPSPADALPWAAAVALAGAGLLWSDLSTATESRLRDELRAAAAD